MKPKHLLFVRPLFILAAIATIAPRVVAGADTRPNGPTCGEVDRELLKAPDVFRYGLTADELQQQFYGDTNNPADGSYNDQSYKPIQVQGYVDNGEMRYATKWVRMSSPGFASRVGLTGAQFHTRYLAFKNTHRLVGVNGYNTPSGDVRYADIWERNTAGISQVIRRDTPAANMAALKANMAAQGYAPSFVEGYLLGGSPHFISLWEKVPADCQWQMEVDLTSDQYQDLADDNLGVLRLKHVDSYQTAPTQGVARYAGIWWNQDGPALRATHGYHWYMFQGYLNTANCDGFKIDSFYASEFADQWNHFGAVWSFDADPNIGPSSSFAVRVGKHVNCTEGREGAAVINLSTGESALVHADQPVAAASAIKVVILGSLLLKDDADDTIELNTKIQITENHWIDSGNNNPDLVLNAWYDLRTLATRMITQSHNGASNALVDFIDIDQINADIAALGFEKTVLNRYFAGPNVPSLHGYVDYFDDVQNGFENFSTPRELAMFYQAMWENGGGLTDESREEFFNIIDQAPTTANDLLPAGFDPALAQFFNKAGSFPNSGITVGDFAHRPQLGSHDVMTEGGLVRFTTSGEVVVYAVLAESTEPDEEVIKDSIRCIGYEMAAEFSDEDPGPLPAECD